MCVLVLFNEQDNIKIALKGGSITKMMVNVEIRLKFGSYGELKQIRQAKIKLNKGLQEEYKKAKRYLEYGCYIVVIIYCIALNRRQL